MLKLQIRRLPPVSEDSFACCVLYPEAHAHSLSAPLLWDSSWTLLVDFWRSLTVYAVNSGNCTCILSYSHQWQLRHTESYHPHKFPDRLCSSPFLAPAIRDLFSITIGSPFIEFQRHQAACHLLCLASFTYCSTSESCSCPPELVVDPCWWPGGDCIVGIYHSQPFPSQVGCLNSLGQLWTIYLNVFMSGPLWGLLFLFLLIYFFCEG